MIINKKTEMKINKSNIKHYKSLGYDVDLKDIIIINTKDLSRGSQRKIKVKCDICEIEKEIKFQTYYKSIKNLNLYSCNKCNFIKSKQTRFKRYGNENYNNREKSKKTNLKKYGVKNVSQSEIIKEKKKETNIKNWGSENVFQNEEIKKISKQTNLEKYGDENYRNKEKSRKTCKVNFGVEYPMQSDKVKEKRNKNNLKKFGKEHFTQTKEYEIKSKKTCNQKYGVDYYFQTNDKKIKSKITMLKKYGVEYPTQSDVILKKMKKTKIKNGFYIAEHLIADFTKYYRKVKRITKGNINKLFESWNGLDYYDNENIKDNFNLDFNNKEYPTIDHKTSVYYGFKNNISVEIIGNIKNLCITKRTINSIKNRKTEEQFNI